MKALLKILLLPLLFNSIFVLSVWAEGFVSAQPIWPVGLENECNITTGFSCEFNFPDRQGCVTTLRLAASSFYRVYLNGNFIARGPARGPHGFYRLDEWNLGEKLKPGVNRLAIEVAGYNADGYGVIAQPSFLQAEVVSGDRVLAATGSGAAGFDARIIKEREQKTQRYSVQRAFSEIYHLAPGFDSWRASAGSDKSSLVECKVQDNKIIIERHVPYPALETVTPVWDVSKGTIKSGPQPDSLWRDRTLLTIGISLRGFKEEELVEAPSIYLQGVYNEQEISVDTPFEPLKPIGLDEKAFHILDFGVNTTGFIGARVSASNKTRLVVTFDEELTEGDVDFKRMRTVNAIVYHLEPGEYDIESFEPYTIRYLKFTVFEGECSIADVYLRKYDNPESDNASFACSDQRLNRVFEAGRETFRQNATDIFMDCPSRERAGWLCDSYFTARAALYLCGNTKVEDNFFENFMLPQSFEDIPEGMLPMCYPSDHQRKSYLPTWAIWFVIQLGEYYERSGDSEMVNALRERVLKLFDYFEPYRNSDGLLENLDGWVILEWSAMNDFINDVNYPINMLYAMALDAAADIYGIPALRAEAEKIRSVIREQSFDGEFFVDNAVREGGQLVPTRNRTESCQYYAFLSGTAVGEKYSELRHRLIDEFSAERVEKGLYPEIHPITPFIGYLLRMEALSAWNEGAEIADDAVAYYLPMVERNGTLWEMDYAYSSRNHGFQSQICCNLFKDVLGLELTDPLNKKVTVRLFDSELEWCDGSIPVNEGRVSLNWRRENNKIIYRLNTPAGYVVEVENYSSLQPVRIP